MLLKRMSKDMKDLFKSFHPPTSPYPPKEMSIELSLEDVKRVASHYGFQFEKEETIEMTYTTNPRSMTQASFNV